MSEHCEGKNSFIGDDNRVFGRDIEGFADFKFKCFSCMFGYGLDGVPCV